MNEATVKDLMEFGFSEREARIYLAVLELGMAPASEIAKLAEIKRPSTYVILEKLKDQGFIGEAHNDKQQQFVASSPEVLERVIDSRLKKEQVAKERVGSILPELVSLYNSTKTRPRIKAFEGKNGLIDALQDTLNSKEESIRVCISAKMVMKLIPEHLESYARKRIENKVRISYIMPDNEEARHVVNLLPEMKEGPTLGKAAFLPEDKYLFSADMAIYDDKIGYMFQSKGVITTIVIESSEITEIMKGIFDLAWEEARRLGWAEGDLI